MTGVNLYEPSLAKMGFRLKTKATTNNVLLALTLTIEGAGSKHECVRDTLAPSLW